MSPFLSLLKLSCICFAVILVLLGRMVCMKGRGNTNKNYLIIMCVYICVDVEVYTCIVFHLLYVTCYLCAIEHFRITFRQN